jgi:acyl carrier protein
MKKSEFLRLLEEMLELDSGTLKGPETLKEVGKWDSVAVMGFIALVDEHFETSISPKRLSECKTIDDLAGLIGDRISN